MYRVRTPGYHKADQRQRWALPDRVFFACGACHILADAFLRRHGHADHEALWIRPTDGAAGHHVVVAADDWIFDYHGYSKRQHYFDHTWKRARQRWPDWDATVVPLRRDALLSEMLSRQYPGLWLREPGQFLHDPRSRAERFLDSLDLLSRGVRPG